VPAQGGNPTTIIHGSIAIDGAVQSKIEVAKPKGSWIRVL